MLTTFPPGIGVLAASANSTPYSIFQIGLPLGLGETIIFHFLLTLLYAHGRDGPMIVIEVLDDSRKCAVGIIYVGLEFPLEVLILQ